MTYCYRADNKRFGGCAAERAAKAAASHCTMLEDLIPAEAFVALPPAAKVGVGISWNLQLHHVYHVASNLIRQFQIDETVW
jgi:hypothetical protein